MTRRWWLFGPSSPLGRVGARPLVTAACLAVLASSTLACGGGASASASPPSLAGKGRSYRTGDTARRMKPAERGAMHDERVTESKVSETVDRDGDGILDADDVMPQGAATGGSFSAKEPAAQNVPAKDAAKSEAPPPPPPQPDPAGQPAKPPPGTARGPALAKEVSRTLIIYTARITLAVYQVDTGLNAVERIAKESGGYLALRRDREITIRVPRAQFETALAAVDKIGDVLHRNVEAQDVTDEFVDLEIRIKNARAMQKRLQQLLERAAVKEAIAIEKELHRVTNELELLEGKIKLLKDKIAYSTITVAFEPRGSTVSASRVRLPFPWLRQLGLPQLLNLHEER